MFLLHGTEKKSCACKQTPREISQGRQYSLEFPDGTGSGCSRQNRDDKSDCHINIKGLENVLTRALNK